jgi:hypothetical protein
MLLKDALHYELPTEGTTLLGYIVRRMHKTGWLAEAGHLLSAGDFARALANVAMYAVAASTSFGRAFYQPKFDDEGEQMSAPDPATGAILTARLESRSPRYRISYSVSMPDGGSLSGSEQITGTTVGLRGLRMPAPSKFHFRWEGYEAELMGTLTSELAPSIFGNTRIRAYGFLVFSDNAANMGRICVERNGQVKLEVNGKDVDLAVKATRPGA